MAIESETHLRKVSVSFLETQFFIQKELLELRKFYL